jgi:Lon protease-like protein
MEKPTLIPLFPLDVVLLPSMALPLHIFEPRYKVMISLCLSEKLEFGMLLAADQSMAGVGCTAEVTQKVRDYPDGRMDIVIEGCSVFQLIEVNEEKEYYQGQVEYLVDEPSDLNSSTNIQQHTRILEQFEKCYTLLFGKTLSEAPPVEPDIFAYQLANHLPLDLQSRQTLLEMRKESDRRAFLLEWIEKFLPALAEREKIRKRAGGNGHASI